MSTGPAVWLEWLVELAAEADAVALSHFRRAGLRVDTKADESPVTDADREIEALVRGSARERFPDLGVLGEEEGEAPGADTARLIVDPIDGTRNFVRGIPVFATLLAIEERGEVVAGVVSAPALGARWRAARGSGAWRGDRRLAVSTVDALERAELFHADLAGNAETAPPEAWTALMRRVRRTRGFGDFWQHLLVAEGAGELAFDPAVRPWDVAPLQVIVEEAGGRATAADGVRTIRGGTWLTSNGLLHDAAVRALAG